MEFTQRTKTVRRNRGKKKAREDTAFKAELVVNPVAKLKINR
jgi:hypothetical protein